MKKTAVFVLAGLLLSGMGTVARAADGFDKELSGLRKNIIGMCAQLQAGQPKESPEQLLKEIDAITSGWDALGAAYKDAPPELYAKDPAWKSYFAEADDNFRIMRDKTEKKDYKRAMQFCGMNCALFVKIHQVNGVSTITDKMFSLRQNLKLVQGMTAAGNWGGANKTLEAASKIVTEIEGMPSPSGEKNESYADSIGNLKYSFEELKSAFKANDDAKFKSQLNKFWSEFNKIYQKYI